MLPFAILGIVLFLMLKSWLYEMCQRLFINALLFIGIPAMFHFLGPHVAAQCLLMFVLLLMIREFETSQEDIPIETEVQNNVEVQEWFISPQIWVTILIMFLAFYFVPSPISWIVRMIVDLPMTIIRTVIRFVANGCRRIGRAASQMMITFILLLLFTGICLAAPRLKHTEELAESWELIGSRTHHWNGSEVLRCRHWDKVAIRWHLETCGVHDGHYSCSGGTNEDFADEAQQPGDDLPRWRTAFSYVQLPKFEGENHHHHDKQLKVGLTGYEKPVQINGLEPLKIDVDWKWNVDAKGCNHFTVRMSALSTVEKGRERQLEEFCRAFDSDGFVKCDKL